MWCPAGFNYVRQAGDEILVQEGRTGCADQFCFFSELVYCFAGRYACVTGDPVKLDRKKKSLPPTPPQKKIDKSLNITGCVTENHIDKM